MDVRVTERAGHATELAREADGEVDAIYVFSGDGGFNEALNGVAGGTPIGFVPGGGASVLPRALGLPRDPVAAARRLLEGRTRRISLGRVNDRRFGFSAGVGFDAELVRRVDARGRTQERGRAGNVRFAMEGLGLLAASRFRLEPVLEVGATAAPPSRSPRTATRTPTRGGCRCTSRRWRASKAASTSSARGR